MFTILKCSLRVRSMHQYRCITLARTFYELIWVLQAGTKIAFQISVGTKFTCVTASRIKFLTDYWLKYLYWKYMKIYTHLYIVTLYIKYFAKVHNVFVRNSLKVIMKEHRKPSSYLLDHAFSLKSNYILNVTKYIMMLKRYGGKNCNLNCI